MLTAKHNAPQRSLEFAEFRRELIRRFFNPQSYFFLCLSTQLENVSAIAADLSEDDYLLIGQLMDMLVNHENLSEKLEQLSALERFRDFHDNLEEGVMQLRESEPSPEEMKYTIEGMAHFMVDALVDILHSPPSRDRLIQIIREESSPDETEPIDINESVVEKHLDSVEPSTQPEQSELAPAVSSLITPQSQSIQIFSEENDSTELLKARGEQQLEVHTTIAPPTEQVEDLIYSAENTALSAVVETSSAPDVDPESAPKNIATHDKEVVELEPAVEPLAADQRNEPMALQEHARRQIEAILDEVHKTLTAIKTNPGRKPKWSNLRQQLQSLRETSMIHGVEEIESLAFKGWRLLELRAQLNLSPGPAWARLYQQLAEALHLSIAGDVDQKSLTDIQRLAETFIALIAHPEKIVEFVTPPPAAQPIDNKHTLAASQTATNVSSLKLPGEDDDELMKLISEVRHERADQFEVPVMETPNELRNNPVTPPAQKSVKLATESAATRRLSARDTSLAQFYEQALLYFEIVEEAVQNLFNNSSSRLALDSLELGAYSLKRAARKLGLEPLARFPEHVEELVKKIIALGVPFGETPLQVIREGFGKLKHVGRLEELETPDMRQVTIQVLKFMKSLDEVAAKPQVTHMTNTITLPSGDSAEDLTTRGSARLRSRDKEIKAKPGQVVLPPASPPPTGRASIDFLMVDDSEIESE